MKQNRLIAALGAVLLLLPTLAGCAQNPGQTSSSSPSASPYETSEVSIQWDEATATKITLSGGTAQFGSSAVSVDGGVITIQTAGDYLISGELTDGQIVVDAGKEDTVRLILSNASISCSDSAAIYARQAGQTVVLLASGTQNTLSDGADYTYAEGEDEPDAALFAKDDLTIAGEGALQVTGNYNNGIGTKDNLVIQGGSLAIAAANDGLRGQDSVTVLGGEISIDAGGNGIRSNNDEDPEKGWISLLGGDFTITAGQDGIQAETNLTISGGTYAITTGGGAESVGHTSGGDPPAAQPGRQGEAGTPPAKPQGDAALSGESASLPSLPAPMASPTLEDSSASDSCKGLKAGSSLAVTGGDFQLDCADDAVHTNGDLTVESGAFTISTGDDGFHADGALTINGGTISILQSYEGLEGSTVEINGGDIQLTASDDGVNAAGGSDGDNWDSFRADGSHFVRITGGTLWVDAQGDGLDSNGGLYLDGGTVLISGPTGNGNGALDYDGECLVTGGVLLAAGSSGMAQGPSASSNQNSLMITFLESQAAGTLVNLSDSQGRSILTFAPSKAFQSLVISSPELVQGEEYTLSTGGSCEDGQNGYYGSGVYTGGTKLCQVTLSDTMTTISSDGTVLSGNMGGGFVAGRGNRGQRPANG